MAKIVAIFLLPMWHLCSLHPLYILLTSDPFSQGCLRGVIAIAIGIATCHFPTWQRAITIRSSVLPKSEISGVTKFSPVWSYSCKISVTTILPCNVTLLSWSAYEETMTISFDSISLTIESACLSPSFSLSHCIVEPASYR